MFITLTIDTNIKNKKTVSMSKSKISPAQGWRRPIHIKKRTLVQRFRTWKNSFKDSAYKLDGQTAML